MSAVRETQWNQAVTLFVARATKRPNCVTEPQLRRSHNLVGAVMSPPDGGSPMEWLPQLLQQSFAMCPTLANSVAEYVTTKLCKSNNLKLRKALDDHERWMTFLSKVAAFIAKENGADADELTIELDADLTSVLLGDANSTPPPAFTTSPPPPWPPSAPPSSLGTPAMTAAFASAPLSASLAQSSPAPAATPFRQPAAAAPAPVATPTPKALAAIDRVARGDETRKEKLHEAIALAAAWAEKHAGPGWTISPVDVAAGERVGRAYKKDRAARGSRAAEIDPRALFELDPDETLADAASDDECVGLPLGKDETGAADVWKPPTRGGANLIKLLVDLQVDLAFTCPCAPHTETKIGSICTHRKSGKKCGQVRPEVASMATATTNAAAVTPVSTQRRQVSPSVPAQLANTIENAYLHAVQKVAAAPSSAAVQRSTTSGAAKRTAAATKKQKKAAKLDALLKSRREAEAAARAEMHDAGSDAGSNAGSDAGSDAASLQPELPESDEEPDDERMTLDELADAPIDLTARKAAMDALAGDGVAWPCSKAKMNDELYAAWATEQRMAQAWVDGAPSSFAP